ncbi:MAG: 2-dehydropantoate 2-reductase [Burkholderiales bacterium]|nr:2-dehydropantoate 2-reductase [Burkholderiales bacterium]MDE2395012.1 2-dehydropantoate 2-reductase [Burkholderiales bacterium]MDE2454563.1 2-dehydropantoate 2-reductase [Burkholderiales bacterium]
MKVCIIGAGAIGGFIGTRLALAGRAEVSAIARGATLQALREQGWRLRSSGSLFQHPARAAERAEELGPQDLVVIAVKAPALAAVAASIAPLLGAQTVVLPAMNGVPWWFAENGPPLESVDPGGRIAAAIELRRVVGCVVHASAASAEPGLVEHGMGQGLIIGEPAGGMSERVEAIAALLAHAGFEVSRSAHVRGDIWYKLWGNMTINPISALTGATGDRVLADPLLREFCTRAMLEASAIGARIGCPIDSTPEDRHRVTAKLGALRPSMLQDVAAGRPIELDAIVGVVHELGLRVGVPTPAVNLLFGLTRLFGQVRGLYPN